MGVIYKAQDIKLNRLVALKFLPRAVTADSEEKQRFIQEAQAASALNHPSIITIYEIDEIDGEAFISMEYVDGGSLKNLLSESQVPLDRFLEIASAVTEGLSRAHQMGIIHRDIKSENILLTSDGRSKITDFGLAKLKGSGTITLAGKVLGTAAYMSPEQVQGEELDARSDIFSLGIVFYELLTGQLPFKGMHPMAIMYSIVNEEPLTPSQVREDIPRPLENVISTALRKKKEERYQSLDLMLEDLKKVQSGTLVLAVPAAEKPPLKTVAVLPFEDLSPTKENEYLANGMADEIITDLSQIGSLKVTPRSSVLGYQANVKDLKEIGKELQVEYVLQGSIKKFGEKIRITAQLTSVSEGFHLWAEKFDGELKDIFEIQDHVSQEIVSALKLKLTPSEIREMVKKPTANVEAYDFYLKGRDYYSQGDKTNIDFAMRMFEKALEVDPDFALAYAGLGDAYVTKYMAYFDKSATWLDEAERTCKRALNLDSSLPEAHRALGRVYQFRRKYPEAEKEFQTAVQVRPDYAEGHRSLAWLFLEQGALDKAILVGKKVLETRPLDKETYLLLGLIYQDQKNDRQALEMFDKAIDIAPDYFRAYYQKGQIYQRMGDYKTAMENYQKALQFGLEPNLHIDLGWTYLLEGQLDAAVESFKKSIELGLFDYRAYYFLALAYHKKEEKWMAAASYDSAVVLCRRQITEDPQDALLYSTLSLALTALKRLPEAGEAALKAFNLDPENGMILYDLARVYALQNDPQKASEILKKALKNPLSPTGSEAVRDPHFEKLSQNSDFIALCESHKYTGQISTSKTDILSGGP
jgi:non-specific serine/threonine protein kinase